jgi:nucleoside-diphosphate-sugar epimerase
MRILFTGASSFSAYWIVQALARAGHEVVATFTQDVTAYEGIRGVRVRNVLAHCTPVEGVRFGDDPFVRCVKENGPWDLLCHHAADVRKYRSPDFDPIAALANNAHNARNVLKELQQSGCRHFLLTGSVTEMREGVGPEPRWPFSPYGLSKTLSADVFQWYCREQGVHFGKFVIPNPFGPMEEDRFTGYLIQSWLKGRTPSVRTPLYIRDNIPVCLLAEWYRYFAEQFVAEQAERLCHPSAYVESQGSFAQRCAREMEARLGVPCPLRLEHQTHFAEPLFRVNADSRPPLDWDEEGAWDGLANYYLSYPESACPLRPKVANPHKESSLK